MNAKTNYVDTGRNNNTRLHFCAPEAVR